MGNKVNRVSLPEYTVYHVPASRSILVLVWSLNAQTCIMIDIILAYALLGILFMFLEVKMLGIDAKGIMGLQISGKSWRVGKNTRVVFKQ